MLNRTNDSFTSMSSGPVQQQIDMPVAKLIAELLKIYGPVVLLLFGLPGNILSYVVMNQEQFRHTTTSFFICTLSVCDNGYLISRCLQRFLLVTFLRPMLVDWNALGVFCIEYHCTLRFTAAASRYVLVLMTYDRLVALLFPLQVRAYPTMKVAKTLTFIALFLAFLEGCFYLLAEYSSELSHWLCPYYFPVSLRDLYTLYMNVTTATTCGLLIIANVLIAWSLYSNAHRMKLLQEDKGTLSKTEALQQRSIKNRQISLMLLLISCFFLISNFPREFNSQFWLRNAALKRMFPDLRSLSLESAIFIEAANYAVNFYLYVASCRKFRITLSRKFSMDGKQKSKPKVIPTDASDRE